MIQDMLGNEFYVGAYKDGARWRTNTFTEVSQFPMDSSSNMWVWECRLPYCVSGMPTLDEWYVGETSAGFTHLVPGQNSWTESSSKVVLNQCANRTFPQREKPQRKDDAAIDYVDMQLGTHFQASVGSSQNLDAEALKAWRWYLASLRSLPHSIASEMQKVVEDDLFAARQADRSLGSQDFSRWLTMGRLMSVSFGETSLSLEHWQMVKELQRQRRERLQ